MDYQWYFSHGQYSRVNILFFADTNEPNVDCQIVHSQISWESLDIDNLFIRN